MALHLYKRLQFVVQSIDPLVTKMILDVLLLKDSDNGGDKGNKEDGVEYLYRLHSKTPASRFRLCTLLA
jgi:hypothetical protein